MKVIPSPLVEVPKTGPIPEQVDMTATHHLLMPALPAVPSTQKTQTIIESFTTKFGKAMTTLGLDPQIPVVLSLFVELKLLRLGIPKTLPILPRTQNAERLLVPAVAAVSEHADDLRAAAPSALEGVDLGELQQNADRLLFVRKLRQVLAPLNHGLEALQTHLENWLDAMARQVFEGAEGAMKRNFGLGNVLDPLRQLVKEPSELAQETKKAYAKVATEASEVTMRQMNKAAAGAPPIPPLADGAGASAPHRPKI